MRCPSIYRVRLREKERKEVEIFGKNKLTINPENVVNTAKNKSVCND